MWQDKEIRTIITDIIYVIFIVCVLSWLWWGPYQNSIKIKKSLQKEQLNQTIALETRGLDEVVIAPMKTEKQITIINKSDESTNYTISFMVEDGKEDQNTNKNNYVMYSIIDEFGNYSEPRNLNLNGYMLTGSIGAFEQKNYTIVLWSENTIYNLNGNLSLIANPVA